LAKTGFSTVLSFDNSATVAGPLLASNTTKGNYFKRFETGGGCFSNVTFLAQEIASIVG
jgi:hypothetical protein